MPGKRLVALRWIARAILVSVRSELAKSRLQQHHSARLLRFHRQRASLSSGWLG